MAALPNEDEAAAIAAALERFRAETATAGEKVAAISPWQHAALLEGVGAKGGLADLEGGERWLS